MQLKPLKRQKLKLESVQTQQMALLTLCKSTLEKGARQTEHGTRKHQYYDCSR